MTTDALPEPRKLSQDDGTMAAIKALLAHAQPDFADFFEINEQEHTVTIHSELPGGRWMGGGFTYLTYAYESLHGSGPGLDLSRMRGKLSTRNFEALIAMLRAYFYVHREDQAPARRTGSGGDHG